MHLCSMIITCHILVFCGLHVPNYNVVSVTKTERSKSHCGYSLLYDGTVTECTYSWLKSKSILFVVSSHTNGDIFVFTGFKCLVYQYWGWYFEVMIQFSTYEVKNHSFVCLRNYSLVIIFFVWIQMYLPFLMFIML